jgi:hypothetical protein
LVKETGATFSHEQLRELVRFGLLTMLAEIEADELCPAQLPATSSVTTGSTSAVMAKHLTRGRLPVPSNDQSYIAALTASA